MSDTPLSKRQKILDDTSSVDQENEGINQPTKSPLSISSGNGSSRTPKKLPFGSVDDNYTQSQPPNSSSSLQAPPSLQPPNESSRSRDRRTYSQSPPRSPGRSPTRKLELIKISPVKKNRLELQKLYDAEQGKKNVARLCIDRLVLQDFKSYAGRQVVGPFHSSFSAVVGPNGSGKSNVIDSMLFVFGFRANKMRQDRLSDLIHNSEAHPNLQSCSVEVHFHYVIDEIDGGATVDEERSKLVVTRKAFRNNSSKYFVNGKESTYTEVTKLLKEEGIDLDHKRFLILQGEVENIAQMRPKAEKEGEDGLLEYLEDITGTAKYKPQIEKLMAKIEDLNETCIEKENRFQIVEQEKNSLESGKEAAMEYLEKEKNLALLRSKLIQYKIWQNNSKLSTSMQKSAKLNSKLEEENQRFCSTLKEIEALENQSKEISRQIELQANQEKTLLAQKRDMDQDRVAMEEKIKNLERKKSKAEKSSISSSHSINESTSKLKELQQLQVQYEQEIRSLNEELNVERAKLEQIKLSLKDKTVDISAKIAAYEKDLEPWDEQLQEKKAQIQLAESEYSLLKDTQSRLCKEIDELKREIDLGNEEKLLKEKTVQGLEEEKTAITKEIAIGEAECSSSNLRLKEMHDILITQRQRTMDAKAALSNAQNKSKVLTALTRLQKSGRISGFHGRLGDLGVIDEKYDAAISTACPRLEDLVVDSVDCGQQCIEYLRKNKLGYARFILLDKLRSFQTGPIVTPEGVPRLFDLVQPKSDKFIPAFYSVLRDTLAACDLAQANRVAYGRKRFRVVTLDGKLIDVSGTMSGGGTHIARGLMRVTQNRSLDIDIYSPDEVAKLERTLAERERNFQVASDTLHQMENELKNLKSREPELELKLTQTLMDIDSWNNDLSLKERQLVERRASYKIAAESNQDYNLLESHLRQLKEEQLSLENQTASTKQRILELKEEIMKIGGSDLQIQNAKVCSILQRIEIIVLKQKKERSSIKKTESELNKLTKAFDNAQKDLNNYSRDIETLTEKAAKVKNCLIDNQETIANVQESNRELNDKSETLKQQLADMEENATEFRSLKIEINDKLGKLNALIGHINQELKQLETDLSKIKIRDVTRTLDLLDEGHDVYAEPRDNSPGSDSKQASENLEEGEPTQSEMMEVDKHPLGLGGGLPHLSDEELQTLNLEEIESQVVELESYVDSANVDVDILEEYARRLAEHRRRRLDLNQAVDERDSARMELEDLKKRRFDEFMKGFGIISMTLKEMYQMITMGGNAELELVDSLDPFSEGVTFSVMPPKKSWRNITNLSGGEKTLSSLALVFALHKYKPTPLYVMDEIDAALDFRNVSIVANYIKERTKNAQFIVISLRNNMFELAQQLVGIYKTENMTKSASLQNIDILDRV